MLQEYIEKQSRQLNDALQNMSDAMVSGTQVTSDLAIGSSEYVSMKLENTIHDFEDSTSDWVEENTEFAGEQLVDMASTVSLFGQLARSASEPVDEKGEDRLKKFGDPSEKVKDVEDEEEYVPRRLRRYL